MSTDTVFTITLLIIFLCFIFLFDKAFSKKVNKKLQIYGRKKTIFNRYGFIINYAFKLLFEIFASSLPSNKLRCFFHKRRGLIIGKDVYLGRNLLIDRVYTNYISIGNHSSIGDRTIIAAHASTPNDLKNKEYFETVKTVEIGDNVWIMPQVTIAPGVKIGNNCFIITGSIIFNSIPEGSVVKPPHPTVIKLPRAMRKK